MTNTRGRRVATLARLPSHSFPSTFGVGVLTLLIIASSLAAPLHSSGQSGEPETERSSAEVTSQPLPSSKAPATTSEVTTREPFYSIYFPYKGRGLTLQVSVRNAKQIGSGKSKEPRRTLHNPPTVYGNKKEGVTTSHWGKSSARTPASLGLFRLPDGRHYLHVSREVRECSACVRGICEPGEGAKEYEEKLTTNGVDQVEQVPPTTGLPPVHQDFGKDRETCTIGFWRKNEDGDYKTGGALVKFFVGDTIFRGLLSHRVECALHGENGPSTEILDRLVQGLAKDQPRTDGLTAASTQTHGKAYFTAAWGSAGRTVHFPTRFANYTVLIPTDVEKLLPEADNVGWDDLKALFRTTLPEVIWAFVRESMQPK